MVNARPVVSISAASSSLDLARAVQAKLTASRPDLEILLDVPASPDFASMWGQDELEAVDAALSDSTLYCIVLLDRAYQREKLYWYRRIRLVMAVSKRSGFILPVQVGPEEVDIKGLSTLGKIFVDRDRPDIIADVFLKKLKELPGSENRRA